MEKIDYRAYFSKELYFEFDRIDIDGKRAYFFKENICVCAYWIYEFKLEYLATYRSLDIDTFITFKISEV